ncbi:MAG: AI-2E family transporter [Saprospiraceae bacterium]
MKKSYPKFFFLILVLLISMAFFGLISEFLIAVFWATIFAILFRKRYVRILEMMPTWPNTAAAITVGLILFIVVIPFGIVGTVVYLESSEIITNIADSKTSLEDQVEGIQDQIPLSNRQLRSLGFSVKDVEEEIATIMNKGMQFLAGQAVSLSQNLISLAVNFFIMLYVLFFFIRDGKRILQQMMWAVPIPEAKKLRLLKRFDSVARATVKGSLLVAILQGGAGGLLFYFLGIPAALLWGVIMVISSLLPIGSALVWGPWMIVLFIQGETTKAIILLVVGTCFIGLIDNLLRPRLVGQDTKMKDYMILISTLGGLSWFGLTGFVLGPIIAALFSTCWYMLGREYANKSYEDAVTASTAEELAGDS